MSLDQAVQHQAQGLRGDNDARTGMPFGIPKGAMCVQRFDDSLEFCNSHYLSHFAAFFIDARTKRSVVESFAFNLIIDLDIGHDSYRVFQWSAIGGRGPEEYTFQRSSGGRETGPAEATVVQ
jgi:hypothetical protein